MSDFMATVKRVAARRSIHDSLIHSIQPRMNTDKPNAACAATTDFGLRREAKRHAAFERNRAVRKAVSPLRSATALQIFVFMAEIFSYPCSSVLPSMKVLFAFANCSTGVVARASCPCVSIKPTFSETHGRDARATILVVASLRCVHPRLKFREHFP
jgi:hypothetical protein